MTFKKLMIKKSDTKVILPSNFSADGKYDHINIETYHTSIDEI